jgi:PIN domain nuclease of toxin-antitoxin system
VGCVEAQAMKVLLDTCAIIWAVAVPDELSAKARSALEDPETEAFYCPMSCAEIAWAVARKRVLLDRHWKLWFRHYVEMSGWECLPINLDIVEEAYSLPEPFHADPVDRLLAATARVHDLHLITGDEKLILYPHVRTIW